MGAGLKIHVECSWDYVGQPRFQRQVSSSTREVCVLSLNGRQVPTYYCRLAVSP
ncbi:RING/U-box superfamily protein with ARM repeat domain-containing protein [Perilla frutescens var. frutescens]|nr:RING/U-box superfamily protein with ARM repeat domain-containing protein [Perilla frutescens var. frutescens]